MLTAIGIVITDHISAGRLEDQRPAGETLRYPADAEDDDRAGIDALTILPAGELLEIVAGHIEQLAGKDATGAGKSSVDAIGLAVPGIVRHGVIEDSPNLPQLKGMRIAGDLKMLLEARGIRAPVHVANNADAIAAGIAAIHGQLNKLTRVWTLGNGVGYGRWPYIEGVWEGGHITVTLDPKEKYCGCGGVGHLEGIMGHRAMRLRFLDMEPEEVFAAAKRGEPRCLEFVDFWHRALAAATASFIHLAGPGRFYITGQNARFVELSLMRSHLDSMVRMSPLQSYSLEILAPDDATALLGAGVSAIRALAS